MLSGSVMDFRLQRSASPYPQIEVIPSLMDTEVITSR